MAMRAGVLCCKYYFQELLGSDAWNSVCGYTKVVMPSGHLPRFVQTLGPGYKLATRGSGYTIEIYRESIHIYFS